MKNIFDQIDHLAALCRTWVSAGWSITEMSAALRAYRCPKVVVIMVLSEATERDMDEIKQVVHDDVSWADVKIRDEAFHDALIDAIAQIRGY